VGEPSPPTPLHIANLLFVTAFAGGNTLAAKGTRRMVKAAAATSTGALAATPQPTRVTPMSAMVVRAVTADQSADPATSTLVPTTPMAE
jgi:hypothetical protein